MAAESGTSLANLRCRLASGDLERECSRRPSTGSGRGGSGGNCAVDTLPIPPELAGLAETSPDTLIGIVDANPNLQVRFQGSSLFYFQYSRSGQIQDLDREGWLSDRRISTDSSQLTTPIDHANSYPSFTLIIYTKCTNLAANNTRNLGEGERQHILTSSNLSPSYWPRAGL